jgi:hypothetical protein
MYSSDAPRFFSHSRLRLPRSRSLFYCAVFAIKTRRAPTGRSFGPIMNRWQIGLCFGYEHSVVAQHSRCGSGCDVAREVTDQQRAIVREHHREVRCPLAEVYAQAPTPTCVWPGDQAAGPPEHPSTADRPPRMTLPADMTSPPTSSPHGSKSDCDHRPAREPPCATPIGQRSAVMFRSSAVGCGRLSRRL